MSLIDVQIIELFGLDKGHFIIGEKMQQMLHHYHNNILQLDDVYFSFCGVSITQPGHSFGPAIRNDFLIHIVIDGEGTLLSDNQLYHLKANQGFLIEPKVPNFYQSSNTNPWKYLWIGFNGEKVPDLLQKIGLSSDRPVFNVSSYEPFLRFVIKCLQEQSDSVASAISLTASIYQFLSVLSSQISKLSHLENKLVNPIIVNVLDYLIKNFNKPISIQDISDSLVFNRSYLSKTFKQSMNISLKEYLTNLRTTYASELLSTTTIPIERISSLCGFNNHDVFTRAFKKKYGQTPLSLRKFHQQRSSAADNENDLYQLLKNFPLVE